LLPKYGSKAKRLYQRRSNNLVATIKIDIGNPLNCLTQVQKIIERCRLIHPDVKDVCLSALKRHFAGFYSNSRLSLAEPLSEAEVAVLNRYRISSHKKNSRKAKCILLANQGRTLSEAIESTHVSRGSIYRWLRNFKKNRLESIEVHVRSSKEKEKAELQTRVIDIVHKTPMLYGINRTTWTYGAIAAAYHKEYDAAISVDKIKGVIRATNYSWRHARRVLTSPDVEYRAKVEKLLDTLQGLKDGERFFFIDEAGPYRVKKYGGKVLMPKDETVTLPEYQKSRGKVHFVAALEAVTNQLTWLFTPDKSAASMLKLFEKIVETYAGCPAIFFTWDAITVHSSKSVTSWISAHNEAAKGPHIEVVPLPSNSQFLNVIESVFGGMKKAVICNSDYPTACDMQDAIARHFEDRNQFFRENPKRAGNKIWDKQRFDFDKLVGGLCKRRYVGYKYRLKNSNVSLNGVL
jgi:transposase